jgi:hypothetical protein
MTTKTLNNWLKDKPKLLNVGLTGIKANKQQKGMK